VAAEGDSRGAIRGVGSEGLSACEIPHGMAYGAMKTAFWRSISSDTGSSSLTAETTRLGAAERNCRCGPPYSIDDSGPLDGLLQRQQLSRTTSPRAAVG
jgi:hypothetical protein